MKERLLMAIVLLGSFLTANAGPIKKLPVTISKPGKYFLIANASPKNGAASADAAITITASNVELDLGGFSVIANPANANITSGVAVIGASEVRIRNGRISGFATGLRGENNAHHLLVEDVTVNSPSACGFVLTKGTLFRRCGFILTSATGTALLLSSSGGGPAHTVESCNFYATVPGLPDSQFGLQIGGQAPAAVRDCQFIGLGTGLSGNNITTAADNLFPECQVKFEGVTTAGFNQ